MGCTESKLDNDDTVRRCKERRHLMKAAVQSRHHLAAAHYDYTRSLRSTASALLNFASGEHFSVSDHTPPVLLRSSVPAPSPPPPPPPPPASSDVHHDTPFHVHRNVPPPPPLRRRKPNKIPHILSESSFTSSRQTHAIPTRNSTYTNTPSHESSIWNWDSFYPPPSPPNSEYFNKLDKIGNRDDEHLHDDDLHDSDDLPKNFDETASSYTMHVKSERDGEQGIKEEIEYSEWGDHDGAIVSTSNSSSDEEGDFKESASVFEPQSNVENEKHISSDSSGRWENDNFKNTNPDRRMVLRHRNFVEIASALKEHFEEAASAGEQIFDILELGREQMDRSFKQLKKTIYHSSGIFSSLSSSWTSKPPLAVKYELEPKTIEGAKSLCSSLDRLLAWEKKLYQEVKAREGIKMEHEKKLALLQSQEYRGKDESELDKTKASIKRLQSLMLVNSQAVSTTSSAIVGLRESHFIPQLIELCHGFMYMWRSMHQAHEMQKDIVQQVLGLVDQAQQLISTSDMHRQATRDLDVAVSAWHSSFCRVINHHRDFITSINAWFKLTLIQVNNEEPSNGPETRHLEQVYTFIEQWKLGVDRVPDTVASESIKSFHNIICSILTKQSEELKMKKRIDNASKKLEKKTSSLMSIEQKYYKSYSMVGLAPPDHPAPNILDARDPLAEKKSELVVYRKRVEDEKAKHSKAVEVTKGMTLNNIQTGLPGVFQAMASFSALVTDAMEMVCKCSYAI